MAKNYNLFLKGDVGGWNFSSDMVNYVLSKRKDSRCDVLINSLGGYVHEALTISSMFAMHGDVHVHYVGMNASAATIASMGAKRITIDASALFLVHQCSNLVAEWDYMNADQLEAHIKNLEKLKNDQNTIDGCIAGMYARRCKKTKDELLALMKDGAWLTAQQALEWGFVDEITNEDKDAAPKMTASLAESIAAAGIPMPPVPMDNGRKQSIFERFISYLTNSNQVNSKQPEETATISNTLMEKFKFICAILGATIAFENQKCTLTEEDAGKIEDAIKADKAKIDELTASISGKDSAIEALNAKISGLESTIEDLKKNKPAATTSQVTESGRGTASDEPIGEAQAIAASKAFLEAY